MKVIKATGIAVKYLTQWREAVEAMSIYESMGRPEPRVKYMSGGVSIMMYAEYFGNDYKSIDASLRTLDTIERLDDLAEEFKGIPFVNMTSMVAELYCRRAEQLMKGIPLLTFHPNVENPEALEYSDS